MSQAEKSVFRGAPMWKKILGDDDGTEHDMDIRYPRVDQGEILVFGVVQLPVGAMREVNKKPRLLMKSQLIDMKF